GEGAVDEDNGWAASGGRRGRGHWGSLLCSDRWLTMKPGTESGEHACAPDKGHPPRQAMIEAPGRPVLLERNHGGFPPAIGASGRTDHPFPGTSLQCPGARFRAPAG